MINPVLRTAKQTDCAILSRLEAECTPYFWQAQQYTDSLNAPHMIQIICINNNIAGAAVWMPLVYEADLLNIFIALPHQHKGYGRWLLLKIIEHVQQHRLKRLVLEVRTSNTSARQLYKKLGFTQCGLRKKYYPAPDGREDALLMEKWL